MSNEKFKVKFGLAVGDTSATIDGTTGDIVTSGDLAVNGGDITTTSTGIASLFNSNATEINIGNGATTAVRVGSVSGVVNIKSPSLVQNPDGGASTTFNLLNTITETLNIGGAATTVSIGANTGTTTINNSLVADDISVVTVDTTNLEVTNIKAKDGTAAAVIANSTGIITVSTELNVDNLNISGNTISSTNTNGDITLAPNGTGNIVLTLANDGNLTNTRNYTLGAIRNSTVEANGNIWAYGNTTSPTRGINLSNSGSETTFRPGLVLRGYSGGASGGRSWLVFENSRGTAASPTAVQSADRIVEMIGQGYNGTQWTGDSVAGGNQPFTIRGAATENWTNSPNRAGMRFEVLAQPAGVDFTGTSVPTIISHSPTTATYISDAWAFRTRPAAAGGTNILQMSLDVNGNAIITGDLRINGNDIQASDGNTNITLNSNSLTTFAGDIQIAGNDIRAGDGNTNIILTSNTLTTFSGDIKVSGDDIQGSGGLRTFRMSPANTFTEIFGDSTDISNAAGTRYFNVANDGANHIAASVIQSRATNGSQFALTNFTTQRSADGINYTPTQSGDIIGQFKFNGNANTSTTPGVPGGPGASISATATENWSSTANGTKFNFAAIRTGTVLSYDIISGTPDLLQLNAATIDLNSYTGTALVGNNITYNRVYGQWQYNNTISPVAANTAYVYPIANGTTDYANVASVGSTSHIIPGALGIYKTQFSIQVLNGDNGTEHTAYFWWRRNGTDVPGSMGRCVVPKGSAGGELIIGWDNMIEVTNVADYWELAYAVSDTALTFPAYGTTAFGPATASLFITLVPIGA